MEEVSIDGQLQGQKRITTVDSKAHTIDYRRKRCGDRQSAFPLQGLLSDRRLGYEGWHNGWEGRVGREVAVAVAVAARDKKTPGKIGQSGSESIQKGGQPRARGTADDVC